MGAVLVASGSNRPRVLDICGRGKLVDDRKWGPTEGACSMVVPAMNTRHSTSALRMPSTRLPSGTPIIGSNTLGSCP